MKFQVIPVKAEIVQGETDPITPAKAALAGLQAQVNNLVIVDSASRNEAINLRHRIQTDAMKRVAEREDLSKPAWHSWQNILKKFVPIEKGLEACWRELDVKLIEYDKTVAQKALVESVEIQKQHSQGILEAEDAEELLARIQVPIKVIKTEAGAGIMLRDEKELEVYDEAQVPDEYWVLDTKALEKALRQVEKDGQDPIPGARLKAVKKVVNLNELER